MNLRLLGAPTLKDVVPSMVDASNVHAHIVSVPGDNLYNNNCEPAQSHIVQTTGGD
jgi:L-lactate dehydrogenase (cytochrome)